MTIGGALILVAAGAILKWAVTAHVSGFDVQTVGTILFVVGLVGLALAILYTFWGSFSRTGNADARTIVRQPPYER
jgi:hypothetical protein